MKIAAAAYPLDNIDDFDAYDAKITGWVSTAADQGADLLVFPEYGSVDLATIANRSGTLNGTAHGMADLMDLALGIHQRLARKHGVHILMGSGTVWTGDHFVNRAYLVAPSGEVGVQDKRIMTRFEREDWVIAPGSPLRVFDTALGKIGVLVCYDAEFPLLGHALVDAGADILLVPSCTDSLAGYTRVKIGAMARALEGQCVVVHAVTQGPADWCPAVDQNIGAAAIYGPPDLGFPDTGIIAQGAMDTPGWTFADIDLADIAAVRADGRVRGLAHWGEQGGAGNTAQHRTLR